MTKDTKSVETGRNDQISRHIFVEVTRYTQK